MFCATVFIPFVFFFQCSFSFCLNDLDKHFLQLSAKLGNTVWKGIEFHIAYKVGFPFHLWIIKPIIWDYVVIIVTMRIAPSKNIASMHSCVYVWIYQFHYYSYKGVIEKYISFIVFTFSKYWFSFLLRLWIWTFDLFGYFLKNRRRKCVYIALDFVVTNAPLKIIQH